MSLEAVAFLAPVVSGATVGLAAEIAFSAAPTAPAAMSVVLVTLVVAMTAGRRVAITTALTADFFFGDHHLAGGHGVLGTSSVAITCMLVLAMALAVSVAGDRWRVEAAQRG